MVKIIPHGGAREVGRSCFEVKSSEHRILLDCGLKITPEGTEYPVGFENANSKVDNIDAVFISHAHLDHTGALPWMEHKGMNCPIFCTRATKDLTRILLKDAYKVGKIQNHHLGYEQSDIKDVMKIIKNVKTLEKGKIDGVGFEFFDAGHIPGSAFVYIDIEGKKILYTGDVKTEDTHMHKGGSLNFPPVDVLMIESTYGDREHLPREKTEMLFIKSVKETLARGGSVIVPVFAVGRAQEVLMTLTKEKWNVPIFLDGMGIRVTDAVLDSSESVRDVKELGNAFDKAKVVKGRFERQKILNQKGIFVTTSGMLTGGPVIEYLRVHHHDPKCSILLTGYQAEETNGRLLLETGDIYIDGLRKKVKCEVKQFDFSAHDGLAQLKNIVRTVAPKKVMFIHGDEKACLLLQEWASAMGFEAYAPKLGEEIEI